MSTQYRVIDGRLGYRFGDDGTVWTRRPEKGNDRTAWTLEWRQLHGRLDRWGYLRVAIDQGAYLVHALILGAFVGPRPPGMICRHLNGNKTDNRLENICWGTRAENGSDAVRLSEMCRGERHPKVAIPDASVEDMRRLYREGTSIGQLMKIFNAKNQTIRNIVLGRQRKVRSLANQEVP